MHRKFSSVAVILACALSGCESPSPTTAGVVSGVTLLSAEGVQQSATGSGHYTSGGEIRTFAFSAVKHADGSVTGNYVINVHASDLSFHVDVTCMDIVDNTAFVAGIIRKASGPPVIEGTVSYFYATDGGEGPDAVDIVSVARINDRPEAAEEFCTQHPRLLPPRVVEQGNVQVR